jgi:simple sugar transport system substrate-binding protein
MKPRMTVLFAALACIGLVVAIAGCGGSGDTASAETSSEGSGGETSTTAKGGGENIAFACATPVLPFFAPTEQGAKDAAEAQGVNVDYTGVGETVTPQAMSTVLQAAVDQHPDALVFCNFFPNAENPIVKQAVKEGIPVFATNSISEGLEDGAIAAFGQSDEVAGEQAAEKMIEEGVKDGLCVNDVPENPSTAARCSGFETVMKAKGEEVETLNVPEAAENTTAILNAVTGVLRSNSSIDGVLALGNIQGPAVVQAVKQLGREGDVKVGTFDVSEEVVEEIESGEMLFTVWQQPYLQGYLPVVSASLYLKYGMSPPGEVATGPTFIDKENVDAVKPAVAEGLG